MSVLEIKSRESCQYDLVSLGEIMLLFSRKACGRT